MREQTRKLPKMVVLVGPTTCGKTQWSLDLAKEFDGEIISADSRQIYKRMNIGTAKVEGEWKRSGLRKSYCVDGIAHHNIDFLDPGKKFSVAEFRDRSLKYAKLIRKNNKVPFLVGGTGLYVQAVVDNLKIPRIPPNNKLRRSFEQKSNEELITLLSQMDPDTAQEIDVHNKRRIIRALEVSILSGVPFSEQRQKGDPLFDFLQIGIDVPKEELHRRIDERVDYMMKLGLVEEIRNLLRQKYPWELPSMSGIGYRQFKGYFEGHASMDECIEMLKRDTKRYARRQLTWFKRDSRVQWLTGVQEAKELVRSFLRGSK